LAALAVVLAAGAATVWWGRNEIDSVNRRFVIEPAALSLPLFVHNDDHPRGRLSRTALRIPATADARDCATSIPRQSHHRVGGARAGPRRQPYFRGIAGPELVESAPTFGALDEARTERGRCRSSTQHASRGEF
jgi:hypothetical protein